MKYQLKKETKEVFMERQARTETHNKSQIFHRILHGTHTIDHAEQIGLGSKQYELISIDQ